MKKNSQTILNFFLEKKFILPLNYITQPHIKYVLNLAPQNTFLHCNFYSIVFFLYKQYYPIYLPSSKPRFFSNSCKGEE